MKNVSVVWNNPIGAGRYKFAYRKGERALVPLNESYKIAIGAGLATCNDQAANDASRQLYLRKQKEAFEKYKKAMADMAKNIHADLKPWVMDELVHIWGADKGRLESMYNQATSPKKPR